MCNFGLVGGPYNTIDMICAANTDTGDSREVLFIAAPVEVNLVSCSGTGTHVQLTLYLFTVPINIMSCNHRKYCKYMYMADPLHFSLQSVRSGVWKG